MTHAATHTTDALAVLNAQRTLPLVAVISVKFAACVTKWATRRRTRLALAQLEYWQMADVGLTPEDAITEASKVFWRA
ncbi:DUF1127 domain-containing protein [Sulfitobacter sp. S190]|uniref:DUF1127 domain-containing protein n=1 Tax=Sulfitobacter sp. S190 TaxID=2867022 RepID=UPI0021A7D908|nr:DUF1127 domain-containing protein [Sulfitobacter sp. S190]UWR20869.1 DUF1127 domain-containing protein [Sulfitobacter sp. S190]